MLKCSFVTIRVVADPVVESGALFSRLFCKIEVNDIEKKFIDVPRAAPDGGSKLNLLNILGRNSNSSPRSTIEKSSIEKRSFESN